MRIQGPDRAVKLFVGFISNDIPLMAKAGDILTKKFGPVDLESDILNFDFTAYYNDELGENLKRKFITFKKLIDIENGWATKILTRRIEKRLSANGKRRINIDPGYIALSKLALFTTKDFYHRIYIQKGIYAQVTLCYRNKTFRPFEWSYPDYKSKQSIDFFNSAREIYYAQFKC